MIIVYQQKLVISFLCLAILLVATIENSTIGTKTFFTTVTVLDLLLTIQLLPVATTLTRLNTEHTTGLKKVMGKNGGETCGVS